MDYENKVRGMRKLLVVTGALLFVTNAATAGCFALMWFMEAVHVCEPNIVIRMIEFTFSAAVAAFGLGVTVRYLKKPSSVSLSDNRGTHPQQQQQAR